MLQEFEPATARFIAQYSNPCTMEWHGDLGRNRRIYIARIYSIRITLLYVGICLPIVTSNNKLKFHKLLTFSNTNSDKIAAESSDCDRCRVWNLVNFP